MSTQKNQSSSVFTELVVVNSQSKGINRIAWSPDGTSLASASDDMEIQVWETDSGALKKTLSGHAGSVNEISWSPDGSLLASASDDVTIGIWDLALGQEIQKLGFIDQVYTVAWSPHSNLVASGSRDSSVHLWDLISDVPIAILQGHSASIMCLAWHPEGRLLASGSMDGTIRIWDTQTAALESTLKGHTKTVRRLAWSRDGKLLASASDDETIQTWDPYKKMRIRILEGHIGPVRALSFSADQSLLATKSWDDSIRIWDTSEWFTIFTFKEITSSAFTDLSFHPFLPLLALTAEKERIIRILKVDEFSVNKDRSDVPPAYFTNSKVVLLGDTGVGKSGLGLVLTGQKFVPTESTHARRIWTLESRETSTDEKIKETREIVLWDLAGQPSYRLIHQLYLDEISVALVVFDSRNEMDPFSGVRHWVRALQQAQKSEINSGFPIKKFLVAARIDRGGIAASQERINAFVREYQFDGYFETSAKDDLGIEKLRESIKSAIAWELLPKVSSNQLFQQIKSYLLSEKEAGRVLSSTDDLYYSFIRSNHQFNESNELRSQFMTCIGRVESRDLIRRLSFGGLVLLQPELLDAYASAMINAAKEEPDGEGSIAEEVAQRGQFRLSSTERVKSKEQERLILIATIEDMIRREIAFREQANEGPFLVFPSQLTRQNPDLPDPEGKEIIFSFDGAILNIYATLVVRLSHSGFFKKHELWKNASVYSARVKGKFGVYLREIEEGRGELILFFDKEASEESRFQFEEYIRAHLVRNAVPSTIKRRRIFVCPECQTPITTKQIEERLKRGKKQIQCNVCERMIPLVDHEERIALAVRSGIVEMDKVADKQLQSEIVQSILQGKIASGDFDVFISYDDRDRSWVENWLLPRLSQKGIHSYTKSKNFEIGRSLLENIEMGIERSRKTILVISPHWLSSEWSHLESLVSQMQDPSGFQRRTLPVVIEKCDLPKRLNMLVYADFTSDHESDHEVGTIREIELQKRLTAEFERLAYAIQI